MFPRKILSVNCNENFAENNMIARKAASEKVTLKIMNIKWKSIESVEYI